MYFGKVITAMVTPFDEQDKVNYDKAVELADYLAKNGTDTVLLTGTTGESPTLTHEEEWALYDAVVKGLAGKAKVMAGTGSNCTRTAIESTKKAEELGVDAALIVAPYYNKPSQEGIYEHFKAISDNTSLPLMIYNIPGRTGINIHPETIKRISELDNYVAIKEASGDLEQIKIVQQNSTEDFLVYSGDDKLTLEVLKAGGEGIVSVAAHLIGNEIQEMIRKYNEGQLNQAQELDQKYQELYAAMFISSNPVPVKTALNLQGKSVGGVRLPLVAMTPTEKEQLRTILEKYSLI